MNQQTVNFLAQEKYYPTYLALISVDGSLKPAVSKIITEELSRNLEPLPTSRGIRTRVHELLQSRLPVPTPSLETHGGVGDLLHQLETHHNHQTAHFQSLWQHTEELIASMGYEVTK